MTDETPESSATAGAITAADPKSGSAQTKSPEVKAERAEVTALRRAKDEGTRVSGKVIGWNRGGFHVLLGDLTAFCPRSEMELGPVRDPQQYLDQSFDFGVLKVQQRGRRIVLSRTSVLKEEQSLKRQELRKTVVEGAALDGRVASLTEFGAFIDLGGVQGLVHVSEISRQRVEKPSDCLEIGQTVRVKVLQVADNGKRISLSIRALLPDPWREIKERFPEGEMFIGRVERVTRNGVIVELEPGLSGLLPTSLLSLPPEASLARIFPPGREVPVQVIAIDERRQRVSLAPEGSAVEGTRHDYQTFLREQKKDSDQGFNALAAAFEKIQDRHD